MTPQAEQYPFVMKDPSLGAASLCPLLPLTLQMGEQTVSVLACLDTAAAVNVMPFDVGLQLGAVWEQQTVELPLTGNLARQEARLLAVTAKVGRFPSVSLMFAWTKSSAVPLLLGQINFFIEFDVCFFRSRAVFDVRPKQT